MGSSCFFLDKAASDKRPAAPFPRTTISLVGATRPYVLQRNRVAVPPDEAKKYLFLTHMRNRSAHIRWRCITASRSIC